MDILDSTLAATLVAPKAGVPVSHVEAGLRSFDLTMPEEINRMVTDRLAPNLLTPSRTRTRTSSWKEPRASTFTSSAT